MEWTHDGEVNEELSSMGGMLELREDSSPKAASGATSDNDHNPHSLSPCIAGENQSSKQETEIFYQE